jgi:DNA-binding MarR family transcriptional regulator
VTDRRCVHVSLTEAGVERVERKRERIGRRRRELFEALSPSERREAARLLSSLAAAMEELR